MRATEFLAELFDAVYPYERSMNGGYFYDNKDVRVTVQMDEMLADTLAVAFNRNFRFDASGAGDQYRILATVVKIIKEWLAQAKPAALTFSSKSDDASRMKLYTKMVNKISPSVGYVNVTNNIDSVTDDKIRRNLHSLATSYPGYEIFALVRKDLV